MLCFYNLVHFNLPLVSRIQAQNPQIHDPSTPLAPKRNRKKKKSRKGYPIDTATKKFHPPNKLPTRNHTLLELVGSCLG